MARRPFSKPIHAKEERNGPPIAYQRLLQLGPPPVLPFLLAVTSKQAVVAQVRTKVIACPCYPYI